MPSTQTKVSFKTRIDIAEDKREELIDLCNQQLADGFDLFSQTKEAHWNVKGINFMQLHELFDMLAAKLPPLIDMLAERATTLGGRAEGTVRQAARASSLEALPETLEKGEDFVKALVERYASYAASTRAAIERASELDEPTTEDLFTEISREIDLSLYFLESHLQA